MNRMPLVLLACLLTSAALLHPCGRQVPAASAAESFLANDVRFNPWSWPLERFAGRPGGTYACDIHMGFLNVDYFCAITPDGGVDFFKKTPRTQADDVTRRVLARLDSLDALSGLAIRYGVGDVSPAAVRALLPRAGQTALVQEGKRRGQWGPPQTHAKVLQLSDGKAEHYTMHGSLNLQTVGLTCKGNNTLRFVETTPTLYAAFAALSESAGAGSGLGRFPGGRGGVDSSGDDLPPAAVGDYQVGFYAGRGQGFVGGAPADAKRPWPLYLNPPYPGQHDPDTVNWYDAALHDAAAQLRQGRDVRLDIAVFEIGQTAWFVEHLFRFVSEGFAGLRGEDRNGRDQLTTTHPGRLTVRFLWQFQSGGAKVATSTTALLRGPAEIRRVDPATGNVYTLTQALVWPKLDANGVALNPGTPRDMHNKLMLLDVIGHEDMRRIYVTSSNLDTPGQGSGKLWQAGTIVSARPDSGAWSGENAGKRHLFGAYQRYFDTLWESRQGQPGAGQAAFHQRLVQDHLAGQVNWIETAPVGADPAATAPREGIDAFFFPAPLGE